MQNAECRHEMSKCASLRVRKHVHCLVMMKLRGYSWSHRDCIVRICVVECPVRKSTTSRLRFLAVLNELEMMMILRHGVLRQGTGFVAFCVQDGRWLHLHYSTKYIKHYLAQPKAVNTIQGLKGLVLMDDRRHIDIQPSARSHLAAT